MISENYHLVLERINRAAHKAGRDSRQVRLVVVTKGHPLQSVQAVIAAGATRLGENYIEEAEEKISSLPGEPGVEWHMIGHVQSRKALAVCEHFDWLHSLDSLKLANRIERYSAEMSRKLPVLLECNVSGEESKYGWPAWDEDRWHDLAEAIAPLLDLPHLDVRGLMTMAPYSDDPETARPVFRRLRHLLTFFEKRFPHTQWQELSMGMSGDFEVAVQEGSTFVRVGTAIMGPRPD